MKWMESEIHEFGDQELASLFQDALHTSGTLTELTRPSWLGADFPYRLECFVGRGGSGFVWKAQHRERSQVVALKVIPLDGDSEVARERWLREAEVASSLKHPHLLGIHEKGLSPDGESAWFALEWIAGSDLQVLLAREGRLTWGILSSWLPNLCDALAELHAKGLVHRDLKPSNFLLEKTTERLVISDFGAALSIGKDRVTRTTDSLISYGYAAPEQLKIDHEIDGRADQYSLAITLWELLTGELPMGSYSKLRPQTLDSPRWLDSVLRKAMSASPDDRYPDIQCFAEALTGGPSRRKFLQQAAAATLALAGAGWGISKLFQEPEILTQKNFKSGSVRVVEGTGVYVQLDVTIQPDGLIKIIAVTRSEEQFWGMKVQAAFALLNTENEAQLIVVCPNLGVTGEILPGNGSNRSDYLEASIAPALFSQITEIRFMVHPADDQPNSPWYRELPEVPRLDAKSLIYMIEEDDDAK